MSNESNTGNFVPGYSPDRTAATESKVADLEAYVGNRAAQLNVLLNRMDRLEVRISNTLDSVLQCQQTDLSFLFKRDTENRENIRKITAQLELLQKEKAVPMSKPQSTELIPLAEYQRMVAELESYKLREAFDKLPVAQPILPSNPPTAFKTHGCEPPAHAFGSRPECGVHITDKDENVTCIRQEGYVGPGIKGQTQGIPGGPSH